MEFLLGWKDLVYLGSNLLGFIIGILLLVYGVKKNKANILIGLSFLSLTYAVFLAFLIDSGYHTILPGLYRTGNIAGLLFAPLSFLYIRRVVEEKELTIKDLFHFIPVLIFIVDFSQILFFTSIEEKRILIQSEIQNPSVFVYFNQSRFFPANFYTLARTFLIVVYWFFSIRILSRYGKSVADMSQTFGREWVIWMKIYVYSELLLFLPFIVFAQFVDSSIGFDLVHLTGAVVILTSGLAILFFPKVLYGFNEFEFILNSQPEKSKSEGITRLSPVKEPLIEAKLKIALDDQKAFLKNGFSISDLAKETGIPTYLLTEYINRKMTTTFSELINQRRIEECCDLMEKGEFTHLSLEGLADHCGFNNRNSFSTAFKKFKGITPSQFQKQLTQIEKK